MNRDVGASGKIARFFIDSKLTPLIIIASILIGLAAVYALPREEEPQIIVPMIDIFVQMPGASPKEVEERVTKPMEKLLWEIPGVEYIYSTSSPGMSMAVVRFYVGEEEENAIVRLQSKLMANYDRIPSGVSPPLVKPRYIDDVPILALTFRGEEVDHYTLRRVVAEIEDLVKSEEEVSITTITGGYPRQVQVLLDPLRLAAFHTDPTQIQPMLMAANQESRIGSYPSPEGEILVHTGGFLRNAEDVAGIVVGIHGDRPVYLKDVAHISDGPQEADHYVFFGTGPAFDKEKIGKELSSKGLYPAVTLTVAKRKGANAITVAEKVLRRVEESRGLIIPDNIQMTVTRHYGETAKEKSDELLWHMFIAVFSVTLLIGVTLGRRESGVVALAIPVTLALTLTVFYLYGYTLNRITLFALIFSIGILVDDAIVVVENVVRHFHLPENKGRSFAEVVIEAVDEVGNPTILATLTVIAAILPMAFVGGLMGPYMRPIPVGASAPWFSLCWLLLSLPRGHPGVSSNTGGMVMERPMKGRNIGAPDSTVIS
ncbi:MAG: efflux RND transporter permease subunit, partial [Pseudomonadota bacterium]